VINLNFNEAQKKAIESIHGPMLILAGAGAGKTRVITNRIVNMIKNHKILPEEILAVTFTTKAAKEMKERVEKMVSKRIEISTFHSFSLKILKQYYKELGYEKNFTIYDVLDQMNIINVIMKKNNFETKESTYEIANFISKFKEGNVKKIDFSNVVIFEEIISQYNDIMKQNNAMDFSDILINLNKLLDISEILNKIQEKFKYIMVDEYQDTNNIQYEIIKKISQKYKNICVVGDENQSIYGFRGANIQNILDFEKDYPDATIIKLDINYRSTQNIVNASNAVIIHNKERIDKTIKSNNEIGEKINYNLYGSEYEEAKKVIEQIEKNIKNNDYDNAILYRVNNQSRIFEEYLSQKKIKYVVKDGGEFHKRKEIRNILFVLNFIHNNDDFYNAFKAINMPRKMISMSTMQLISNLALKHGITLLEAMMCSNLLNINKLQQEYIYNFAKFIKEIFNNNQKISTIVEKICNRGYYEYLKTESVDYLDKIDNINEFKRSIEEFENNSKEEGIELLSEFLEHIENLNIKNQNESNAVKLMTIHSSKGLEFNNVFIIGMEEGQLPKIINGSEEKIEEERRLFYVALTRAKRRAYLSMAKEKIINNKIITNKESRFISEIPIALINDKNIKKTQKKLNVKSFDSNIFDKKEKNNRNIFKIGDRVFHENYGEGIVAETKKVIKVFFMNAKVNFDKVVAEKELRKIK
jgi:DNA helicase-2/ATP-dependent DNA helicase PcrA